MNCLDFAVIRSRSQQDQIWRSRSQQDQIWS